jgi:hypothetical protein
MRAAHAFAGGGAAILHPDKGGKQAEARDFAQLCGGKDLYFQPFPNKRSCAARAK